MRFLADLALFVEVAKTRSFSQAASTLGIPPSTLSRRLSALERELGFQLVHRSTRTCKLTDAGQACYEQSTALVAEALRIQDDLAGLASKASGHIRVGVPSDLAQTIFLPLFSRYMLERPGISIEVLSTTGHPNVLNEGLDVGIMVGHQLRLPDSSLSSRRVGGFARRLYASEAYLAEHEKPVSPDNLADHLCIRLVHGKPLSQWDLRRGREQTTVTVSGTAFANSVGLLARFAREGMGIVILPDFLADHSGFGDGLEPVLEEWEAMPAHLFAVTPSNVQSKRVRELISFVKENFEAALSEVTARP